MIAEVGGKKPNIHPSVFIADSADVIGDVTIGEHASQARAACREG